MLIDKAGFNNEKYLEEQTAEITRRVKASRGRLYLEFGGKLMYDHHAARVLPGYDPNVKLRLLEKLKEQAEIILCIYAGDIEKRKIRGDFGITYDSDALMLIDGFRSRGIQVRGVVITRFEEQPSAVAFENKLKNRGVDVFRHYYTRGYPTDVDLIVSEEGYGRNDYVAPTKPLVVVTGPGPGSGKLATCLSQLYHDYRRNMKAGYAKFETFPVWNLPLKHPVNDAYEAATADLLDVNLVDPFHLDAYGEVAINYNRDVEAFPLVRRILEKITGTKSPYSSPTDMGVNRVGFGIENDQAVRQAAEQEIIRRCFRYRCEYVMGLAEKKTVEKIELLMDNMNLTRYDRPVVEQAEKRAEAEGDPDAKAAAIQLRNGSIVTGRTSELMHAASAAVLNAVKKLAGINPETHLLSPDTINSIRNLKQSIGSIPLHLDLEEVMIALSVSAASSPEAAKGMAKLTELRNCEAHLTHMPSSGDESGLRNLGINVTSDPRFASSRLFTG
ncbi:hypothetical protein CSA37_05240 [Candidatus Fermentibacteria bacterium]|nr:MAG: hypothetical protein CSA37_05240 [Candidatus Fermentibacteria bacterium]